MLYYCAECGLGVIVIEDRKIRACSCDAPIIAEARSNLVGAGGVANGVR